MCHRNAPLTPTGRLRLAWCIVEDGWPLRRAAERFQVSHTTAKRWADRYRLQGWRGACTTAPAARTTHQAKQPPVSRNRWYDYAGNIASAPSGSQSLQPHRRLDRSPHPAGPSPAAAGHAGPGHRPARPPLRTRTGPANCSTSTSRSWAAFPTAAAAACWDARRAGKNRDRAGLAFLHTALDDHSRLAYTEDLPDEKAATCAGFLQRAAAWFAGRLGVTVERVLTDNAWSYTKTTWHETCRQLGIQPRWTRPWRPQTNGKVERFHRTLLDEWAYHQPYTSDAERQAAFTDWLDLYNYHRPHTGISGQTPASRVTNLSGQHN